MKNGKAAVQISADYQAEAGICTAVSDGVWDVKERRTRKWVLRSLLFYRCSKCRYFSLVASPPRICRSDLLVSNTLRVWAARAGLIWMSRSVTSLCMVVIIWNAIAFYCIWHVSHHIGHILSLICCMFIRIRRIPNCIWLILSCIWCILNHYGFI